MRWREEREHEPCPHCGRNSCGWHRPGRVCSYAYADQPGEVKPVRGVTTLREYHAAKQTPPAGKVA
jgi:hypothetical protein